MTGVADLPGLSDIFEGAEAVDDDVTRASRARKGSPFLSTEQAAFYLGISPRQLQQMRGKGTGPFFRRHTRYIRYHIDDLDAWSRGIRAENTAHVA